MCKQQNLLTYRPKLEMPAATTSAKYQALPGEGSTNSHTRSSTASRSPKFALGSHSTSNSDSSGIGKAYDGDASPVDINTLNALNSLQMLSQNEVHVRAPISSTAAPCELYEDVRKLLVGVDDNIVIGAWRPKVNSFEDCRRLVRSEPLVSPLLRSEGMPEVH